MSAVERGDHPFTSRLDRRSMLAQSALGGAALAAALMTPARATAAGLGQEADGLAGAVAAGRMRRVVTGTNRDGKSFIVSDAPVPIDDLWRTSQEMPLGEGPALEPAIINRATGGSRCFIVMLPPSGEPLPSLENRIGFHRTGGVAYCVLLTGEVTFLVDVEEVALRAGDLVVERGTDHSWRNEGTEPVALLVVVVEGEGEAEA